MKPTSPFDELWGTFAVDDHKRERAFVAEVILFDRLVVPQPPENDAAEWAMWIDEDWRPDLLKATVDALEDLIIPVPWDKNLRRAWKGEYKSLFGGRASLASNVSFDFQAIRNAHPDNPAMWTTRMVLANKLNAEADEALFKKIKNVDIDPAANIGSTDAGYSNGFSAERGPRAG